MDLHDRVALITGASGGLGAVIARILADHGVHIAVTHLGHRDEAVGLCRQIEAKGRKSFLVHLDQTDPASCSAAVEATVNALGRLDILINNAAWNDPVPLPDLDSLTRDLGSSREHQPPRPLPHDSGSSSSPQAARPSSRRQHLGCTWAVSHGKHRLGCIEGGSDPSHPLLGSGTRALDRGKLHRARPDGGHPHIRSCSTRPSRRGERPRITKTFDQPRGYRAAGCGFLSI